MKNFSKHPSSLSTKCVYLTLSIIIVSLSLFAQKADDDLILDIIFTNDMHGGIDRATATFINPAFPPILGGGASAATYIKMVRGYAAPYKRDNLLVDVGDFFMGRPVGTITEGEAIIEYMNMIEYDAIVLGNHEYDLGQEKLLNLINMAHFPVLGANIYCRETDQPVDYVLPYIIFEKMGLKIGLIGLTTTDTALMSFEEHIRGLYFKDKLEVLTHYIDHLRNVENVDILIVGMHAGVPFDPITAFRERFLSPREERPARVWGYDAQELAHLIPGIDIILAGHVHVGRAKPWVDPKNHTLIFQNFGNLSGMTHIILRIDRETKTISGFDTPSRDSSIFTLFEDQWIPDPEFDRVISARVAEAEKGMDDVIGVATNHLSRQSIDAQNAMGNFVCEAMRKAVNADFSFINLGGVRSDIPMGNVTYRHVFNAMPFDNMIVTLLVDGNYLKRIIETRVAGTRQGLLLAGGKVIFSRRRADFDRVTYLEIGGEPWDPNKIYRVATTDFLLAGNAGLALLTTLPENQIIRHEINLRDAMADYFRNHSPVRVEIDDRWKRDDRSTPRH
jgi:2',3'-cyclic-nucleotide 2'-phosphodiesterase (5'-nucleotidase family)